MALPCGPQNVDRPRRNVLVGKQLGKHAVFEFPAALITEQSTRGAPSAARRGTEIRFDSFFLLAPRRTISTALGAARRDRGHRERRFADNRGRGVELSGKTSMVRRRREHSQFYPEVSAPNPSGSGNHRRTYPNREAREEGLPREPLRPSACLKDETMSPARPAELPEAPLRRPPHRGRDTRADATSVRPDSWDPLLPQYRKIKGKVVGSGMRMPSVTN